MNKMNLGLGNLGCKLRVLRLYSVSGVLDRPRSVSSLQAQHDQSNQQPQVVSIHTIRDKHQRGEKITMVTAYDYPSAAIVERAGVDMILVGDSLGMVVLGYNTTVPVELDHIIHHCRAVVSLTSKDLLDN